MRHRKMPYQQANTDWLSKCKYGIGVHWTVQTVPKRGPVLPFNHAVETFDVNAFTEMIESMGANYLIFTTTHAIQWLPGPNPILDKILPGRTCERDLLMEIAKSLSTRGVRTIFYYNHSCNNADDLLWEQVVGYHDEDKNRLVDNLCNIIAWMGKHYEKLISAWWFDSAYSLDPKEPHNTAKAMGGFQFPWERYTAAAKIGYPKRLVTYNAGVNQTYLFTEHQDYWAGEMVDLEHPPKGRFAENGLQWHGWTCLDDRKWVHSTPNTDLPPLLYSDERVTAFVRKCNKCKAPMTFNIGIYQDGTTSAQVIRQMQTLKNSL
ncbi:MAG: hypothetical protein CO162_00520 [bacterium (Candidatus Ratteibacteria) CG_4_9_14_3_um_filter_41_21]|uniref:Glycoside hydrolase family 29 N-terminal domain-containing protein n=1 Tax=bacterium (Candidatus Ratteibacteria) CG_4_9_14_3_um_filter_41_21 TaxID=2014289 RepID=A0A2M7YHV5_9BACT|nr:MAG: hypothetical protein CO162_00520 [bacterium (Candidatus Ratteibacteria) CG_4_9_14_3_um_filter_41_21]